MSMNIGPASLVLTIYFAMFTFLYLVQINPMLWPQNADIASIPCFCAFFSLEEREFRFHGWRNVPFYKWWSSLLRCWPFFLPPSCLTKNSMLILEAYGLHQKVFTWSSLRNLAEDLQSGSWFLLLWLSQPNAHFFVFSCCWLTSLKGAVRGFDRYLSWRKPQSLQVINIVRHLVYECWNFYILSPVSSNKFHLFKQPF